MRSTTSSLAVVAAIVALLLNTPCTSVTIRPIDFDSRPRHLGLTLVYSILNIPGASTDERELFRIVQLGRTNRPASSPPMSRAPAVLPGVRPLFLTLSLSSPQSKPRSPLSIEPLVWPASERTRRRNSRRRLESSACSYHISLESDVPALPNFQLFYNPPLDPMTDCG